MARIATIADWPLILIDLETEEGVIGRSYLEPYLPRAMRYLVPMLHDLGELLEGRPVAPVELFDAARRSLHFVGYGGLAMIAVSGLDMAAWDALARAAGVPLCVLLGGTRRRRAGLQQQRAVAAGARGGGGKRRWSCATRAASPGSSCGSGATGSRTTWRRWRRCAARSATDIALMVDFNQGLNLADALARCHAIDGHGLAWIEEPVVYDDLDGYARLAADLHTPMQIGENFYGPRDLHRALQAKACDLVMPDFMRIGGVTGWLRAAPIAAAAGIPISTHLYPEVAAHVHARHRDRALAGMAELGRPDPAGAVRGAGRDAAHPRRDRHRDRVGRGGGDGASGRG